MRKSTKIFAAVAAAGLMAAGATAFTASNTFASGSNVAGFGASTVTGATVTNINYVLSADPTMLSSVVFTASNDVSQATATMRLLDGIGGSPLAGQANTCTDNNAASTVITCTLTDDDAVTIASVISVDLTVVN